MEENKNNGINPGPISADEMLAYAVLFGIQAFKTKSQIAKDVLKDIKHEATRAREYLRLTGATMTPDKIHEVLGLRTSRATLGRKLRAASRGENAELVRSYYVNERGTKIAQYSWNTEYKEAK